MDSELANALITQIQAVAPDIASSLQGLAESFQFEQIFDLTEILTEDPTENREPLTAPTPNTARD